MNYGTLTEGRYADLLHDSGKARHGFDIRQYGFEVELATGDHVLIQGGSEARGESGGLAAGVCDRVSKAGEDVQVDVCLFFGLDIPVE